MAEQVVMAAREMERSIARLANEISERLGDPETYVLVGILSGGAQLCKRLADAIGAGEGSRPLTGTVDITLYRDDLYTGLEKPILGETRIPGDLTGRGVVLVDDVLFTGRTVRAALDELMDYGRPSFIKLAVMVDRGHRELPIAADFVGRSVPTQKRDSVIVRMVGDGSKVDEVVVVDKQLAGPGAGQNAGEMR